jgi:biotin carboxylase
MRSTTVKVLLLCTGSGIAYKVLRCAARDGRTIHVLGDERSRELRASRYCARYLRSRWRIAEENVAGIAAEINEIIAARQIDVVMPGDSESTRVLAAARTIIHARCYPLPDAQVFDRLANKWTFKKLCDELRVPSPASRLLADKRELTGALEIHGGAGWIAKPVNREGSSGFVKFNEKPLRPQIDFIDYEPILVQDFVGVQDLCISLLCHEGRAAASAVYTHDGLSVQFRRHDALECYATQIAAHFRYSGVLCFDARLDADGQVSFIECNPRFWNHIDATMLCGLNFVDLGLRTEPSSECVRIPDGTSFRNVIGVRQELARSGRVSGRDVKVLFHWLRDYSFVLRGWPGKRRV